MDPQQLNGYAYGNNSPVTYADPDGQWGFSLKSITKVVFQPIVKTIIQPVTTFVTRYTPIVVDSVRKFIADPVAVTRNVIKKIPGIKKVVQTIRKVVHNAGESVKKFYRKHIEPRIESARKNHDKFRKSAGAAIKKAAKATWEGTKTAGKWIGKESMPGGKIWAGVKLAAGIASLTPLCPGICAGIAAGMSAVDAGIAVKKGNWGTAAVEAFGAISPGAGKLLTKGAAVWGARGVSSAKEFGMMSRSAQLGRVNEAKFNAGNELLESVDKVAVAYDGLKFGAGFFTNSLKNFW